MKLLSILQIVVGIVLTALILIQSEGQGISSAISRGQFYGTKRGMEKAFFILTIVLAVVFVGLSAFAYLN